MGRGALLYTSNVGTTSNHMQSHDYNMYDMDFLFHTSLLGPGRTCGEHARDASFDIAATLHEAASRVVSHLVLTAQLKCAMV